MHNDHRTNLSQAVRIWFVLRSLNQDQELVSTSSASSSDQHYKIKIKNKVKNKSKMVKNKTKNRVKNKVEEGQTTRLR